MTQRPQPNTDPPDVVHVPRAELEQEHRLLLARVQQLRKILGYPPVYTGKEQRRQQSK